jgi:hypothetical protein
MVELRSTKLDLRESILGGWQRNGAPNCRTFTTLISRIDPTSPARFNAARADPSGRSSTVLEIRRSACDVRNAPGAGNDLPKASSASIRCSFSIMSQTLGMRAAW